MNRPFDHGTGDLFPWEVEGTEPPAAAGPAESSDAPVTDGADEADEATDSVMPAAADAEQAGALDAEAGATASAGEDVATPGEVDAEATADPGEPAEPAAAAAPARSGTPETVAVAAAPEPRPRDRSIARREYYSISEVCELVGLKPHVLRYWEAQFPLLSPSKNRSGNRVYQRKEIRLVLLVKQLLYEEKYTVEGARVKLEQLRRGGDLQLETGRALNRQMLELLRTDLTALAELFGDEA
jgi:DNA-binding transcriptional MerR regulator